MVIFREQNSINMLPKVLALSRYLGLSPLLYKNTKLNSIFPIIFLSYHLYGYTMYMYKGLSIIKDRYSASFFVLIAFYLNLQLSTTLICLISSVKKIDKWKLLTNSLHYNVTKKSEIILVIILHSFFISVVTIEQYVYISHDTKTVVYMAIYVYSTEYLQFFITFLIYSLTLPISERYAKLGRDLLDHCLSQNGNVNSLEDLLKEYQEMHNIVELFNNLFGWPIFTIFLSSGLKILSGFSYFLNLHDFRWIFFTTYAFQLIIYGVSIFSMYFK